MNNCELAINWVANRRSVALKNQDKPEKIVENHYDFSTNTNLASAIDEILMGHSPNCITKYRIHVGPGSYTGIRIAISMVQGMSIANQQDDTTIISIHGHQALLEKIKRTEMMDIQEGDFIASYAQRGEYYINRIISNACNECFLGHGELKKWGEFDISEKSQVFGSELKIPDEYLQCIDLSASDLFETEGNTFTPEESFKVEPFYVRPQEFTKAPPARFQS